MKTIKSKIHSEAVQTEFNAKEKRILKSRGYEPDGLSYRNFEYRLLVIKYVWVYYQFTVFNENANIEIQSRNTSYQYGSREQGAGGLRSYTEFPLKPLDK